MASNATAGDETLVNSTVTGEQSQSFVTALDDGGWVVTWSSYGQDGNDFGVYQQRYDQNGDKLGAETLVNTYTTSAQTASSITTLVDGGWLVTWQSTGQDGGNGDIYQQRYDAEGAAVGSETLVNTTTASIQASSAASALADGGWVVAWSSYDQDGDLYGVYMQRFDSDGDAVGGETRVNTYTTSYQSAPSVTTLADGDWVVTWSSNLQDGSAFGIYQQLYDGEGDKIGAEARVNANTADSQTESAVAALADGGWIVSFTSRNEDGAGYGVYQQRYDRDGGSVGAEVHVNTYATSDQNQSAVTALADGGWVVTWQSNGQDGGAEGIYQQRYDENGVAIGSETQVNAETLGSQGQPTVAALAGGGWVVTWSSSGQDGDGDGIYQRHFADDIRGSGASEKLTGTGWDEYLVGFGGNDKLDGKGGADIMVGGFGNDTYVVDNAGDQIQELAGQGRDTVLASTTFSLAAFGAVENLTLTGSKAINGIGNGLANLMIGNAAANTLHGGAGNDTLTGGAGKDELYGEAGRDTFVFNAGDTAKSQGGADTIHAFLHSDGDRIDLSHFDADSRKSGLQDFDFIGSATFSRHADELRFDKTGADTYISGDVNGDGKADFFIHLDSGVALKAGDFIL